MPPGFSMTGLRIIQVYGQQGTEAEAEERFLNTCETLRSEIQGCVERGDKVQALELQTRLEAMLEGTGYTFEVDE